MKKAVNLRLDERIIFTLNELSDELHSTKTEIIEKAIKFFAKQNHLKQSSLLKFAGSLKQDDASKMLDDIKDHKNSKNFELDL